MVLNETEINDVFLKQQEFFRSNVTKSLDFRIRQLKNLKEAITNNEKEIEKALKKDLNKPEFEVFVNETGLIIKEINFAIKNLKKWSKTKKVKTPMLHFPSKSYIYTEPYGVSLIISPWNYPLRLTIPPLIGSISAGNCTIIKPSEHSAYSSKLMADILNNIFDEKFVKVIEGKKDVSQILLRLKFDYIFYTGSSEVAKIVMKNAAENLTPVTLELGGKSPCIVDDGVDLKYTAKRIVWGKFMNEGQTCVAPDYLLVKKSVKEELIKEIMLTIEEFYGKDPQQSPDYSRIINEKQFDRLAQMKDSSHGEIIYGGIFDRDDKYISPTIFDNISWDDALMEEEIFGPLFPVIEYGDIDNIISTLQKKPKPLALYIFTNNKELEKKILQGVSFGGGCINDTVMHLGSQHLPFGGVGQSGMGSYGGKASFDTFSHKKSILRNSDSIDIQVYPPYKEISKGLLRWIKRLVTVSWI